MKFGLSKNERIKKKNEFKLVYSSGTAVYTASSKFKAVYLAIPDSKIPIVKVAFGVFKKAGNAVWRNRLKRLMKEAYRMNKHKLLNSCKNSSTNILLVFSPVSLNKIKNKKNSLAEVEPEIMELLDKIESRI